MKPSADIKDMASSLSVDAAEFVPKFSASQMCSAVTALPATSLPRRKGDKPVEVTEVPGYLTSCYPFVSPEDAIRHQFARFPQQYPYTAGLSPSLSMSVTPPIRFPAWQTVKPEFFGNLQTSSYGSMPFDLLTSLPVDMSNVRNDSLLLTPPKVAMPVPASPAPGLLLAPHPDPAAMNSAWIMAMTSPVFLQQQQQNQQQLHSSFQQLHPAVTAGKETCVPLVQSSKKQIDKSKGKTGSAHQREMKQEARPESPVLISRSSQTDLPPFIWNLTLEERPHPLYVSGSHKNPSSSRSPVSCEGDHWKTGNEDYDSGYNSPMHKKNLVSSGVQAVPVNIHSGDRQVAEQTHTSGKSWGKQQNILTHHSHQGVQEIGALNAAVLKSESEDRLNEDVEEGKKKRRKKKDHRDISRSPRLLGTNTKLISRSSSSVSSAGTKADEDDEKIDLHSWTDFPPVSSRIGAPSASSKNFLKSSVSPSERVPLTVERSAHEPPWSIKFSSADQLRSERHRSSSGDKDKCLSPIISSPPESAWGRIGRSFRSSQTPGLGQELSHMISSTEKVPLLNFGGKTDGSVANDANRVVSAESVSRNPSLQLNKNNASLNRMSDISRTDHKHEVEPGTTAEISYSHTPSSVVTNTAKKASLVNIGSVTLNQPVISASSSPLPASPAMLQSNSLINPSVVPLVHIRPSLQPGINYQLNEQFQRSPSLSPRGNAVPNHPFTPPAVNSTERTFSVRPPNPIFLPRGTTSQTLHSVIPPFHSGSVAFTQPPPPISSIPFSGYNGVLTYPPPMLSASGMVSNGPYHHNELGFQPPLAAYASGSVGAARNLNVYGVSHAGATTVHSGTSSTVHSPIPASAATDVKSQSVISASAQQHKLTSEPKSATILDSPQNSESEGNKKRRRRRRRRSRTKQGNRETEEAEEGSDGSQMQGRALSSSAVSESVLHFEDEDEFPDLLTSISHGHPEGLDGHERSTLSGTSITYSDILKSTWSKAGSQSRTQSLTGSCVSGDIDDEDNTSCHTGTTNESKRARKRRKRREQANKAAEAELAEISLEQQWLKEVGLKKPPNHRSADGGVGKATPGLITNSYVINEAKKQTSGKGGDRKSQQPIAFDIAAMIDAIQKKPVVPPTSTLAKSQHTNPMVPKKEQVTVGTTSLNLPGNMLDSSAPLLKRGKEREVGKTKKPSPLKKVILKEREQRKMLMLLDEDPDSAPSMGNVGASSGVGIVGGESELSQDALSNKSGDTNSGDANGGAELSADFSPISQTSPISMSPASPGNSGVNSPIAGSVGRDPVVMKIHSRRFREYCTQILDKEIDQCCTSLLQDLVKFQDRMYHKDPVKAKSKRRLVLGLREVTKHLKLKKIKCVVISPNLEKIQSKGGLDEALNNILNMCREQNVPFVFALGRRALGRACAKLVPVSVVGIFNYEGCESKYQSLISLTAAARSAYNEMVLAVEKEVAEYPTMLSQTSSIGGVPGLFAAHMGHSRTPSGCSAISFTSSILSEPISENFPHAEPEVDSKGYEIVRDAAGNVVHPAGTSSKGASVPPDIDDGNEADTEDFGETRKKRRGRPINSVRFGGIGDVVDGKDTSLEAAGDKKNSSTSIDSADDMDERSTVGKLSRNVSELTLTNEDKFNPKGAGKHESQLRDSEDDSEKFDIDTAAGDTDAGHADREKGCRGSKSPRSNPWAPVSHIDSIHSQSYNLGDEILSRHSAESHDSRVRGHHVTFVQNSDLTPSTSGAVDGDDLCTGQISDFADRDDDDDDVDNNVDDVANMEGEEDEEEEEEEEEEEAEDEASKRHHRVIDKERIKSWLESQSNISAED